MNPRNLHKRLIVFEWQPYIGVKGRNDVFVGRVFQRELVKWIGSGEWFLASKQDSSIPKRGKIKTTTEKVLLECHLMG